MSGKAVDGGNLLLGKGKVYFDRFDGAGARVGERFLGNVEELTINTTDNLVEKYSSADAEAGLIASVNTRRLAEFGMKLSEFDAENVALAMMGDTALQAQTGAAVTGEAIADVKQGYYYPLLYRQVSLVTVTDGASVTYDVTDDYEIDAVSGRIYIVPGGAITEASDIEVDYTYATISLQKVTAGTAGTIDGYLRFIGDPAHGPVWELEVWHLQISPDGNIPMIGEDYASFGIKGKVIQEAAAHPSEPYFRAIKR